MLDEGWSGENYRLRGVYANFGHQTGGFLGTDALTWPHHFSDDALHGTVLGQECTKGVKTQNLDIAGFGTPVALSLQNNNIIMEQQYG